MDRERGRRGETFQGEGLAGASMLGVGEAPFVGWDFLNANIFVRGALLTHLHSPLI